MSPRRWSEWARSVALSVIQGALRVTLSVLPRLVPQTRSVVVSAFPETEGNALETARALLRRYPGRVVWFTDGHTPHPDVRALAADGLVLVSKASWRGLVHYLRAEAVFFTHGLYGGPRPSRRKPLVNLWHGDGPKATRPGGGKGGRIPSTYLVAGTELFGRYKAAAFDVPAQRLLVTGNPRTDQLVRRPPDGALECLGITQDFVVWMPTFRRTRPVGAVRRWSEAPVDLDPDTAALTALVADLRDRGLRLVVKPHPLDADRRRLEGAVTVSERDLVRAGVSLYSLLGRSRGLVTDYSSVWVDYLLLDRPLAFFVPDADSYERQLVPADVLDWVPGEVVDRAERPFACFLADLDSGGRLGAGRRAAVARRLGLHRSRHAADDLLDALAARGALDLR